MTKNWYFQVPRNNLTFCPNCKILVDMQFQYFWNSRNWHLCENSPYFWNSRNRRPTDFWNSISWDFFYISKQSRFWVGSWKVRVLLCVHFPLFSSLSFSLSLLYTNIIANWFQERLVLMYFAFQYLMVWIDCTICLHYADIIISVTRTLFAHLERCTLSQFLQSIILLIFVFARFSSLPSVVFLLLLSNLIVSKDQNAI